MSQKRAFLLRLLMAACLGVSGVVVAASPASAAVPVCNYSAKKNGVYIPVVYPSNSERCWMQQGHNTAGVKMLQKTINICYGDYLDSIGFPDDVDEDGDFGPITREALRWVQRLEDDRNPWGQEVVADGIYGSVSLRVMFHPTGIGYNCQRF